MLLGFIGWLIARIRPRRDTLNRHQTRARLAPACSQVHRATYTVPYNRGATMRPIRFSRDIRPLSEFRANAAAFIQQLHHTRRPLVLTQRGKSAAVLLDVEEYERLLERAELLEDVATAEEQLAGGEGVEHAEARAQLQKRIRR